jgi:hypothetical protein
MSCSVRYSLYTKLTGGFCAIANGGLACTNFGTLHLVKNHMYVLQLAH